MSGNVPITVAYGDGIGPEIMAATLHVIQEAGARIDIEVIEIGEKVYLRGNPAGIEDSAWESLRRTKVFLKAPITTPQGGGFKSLNVTTRKALGLYANIRPCVAYAPYIDTLHPGMDVVIVRENEEDLYAGIEYRQSIDVMQGLKLITRPGTEKIVRYAFEYARQYNRKKVTCFAKDNIMKFTDGLFHKVFDEIGEEYPEFEKEFWIVDIGAAKLADTPLNFDVVVMPNLYGDILSDVEAQIAGSVGLAGSANIGDQCAMFEAIHGSAPRRAGQNLANPSGLLLGAVQMLVHIGQDDVAARVHNAWLKTIEDGIHTYDIYKEGVSREKVGTREFGEAVVARLGQKPETLKVASYKKGDPNAVGTARLKPRPDLTKTLVGVDVFIDRWGPTPDEMADGLLPLVPQGMQLKMLSNRGQKVWPGGFAETFRVDTWRCRFLSADEQTAITPQTVIEILTRAAGAGFDVVKTENLYNWSDGTQGYSQPQGG